MRTFPQITPNRRTERTAHAVRLYGAIAVIGVILAFGLALPAMAAAEPSGNLVDVAWLQKNLARADILILDASSAQAYAAAHIPGAVSVDLFGYGAQEIPLPAMEERLQSWGVSPGKTIVLYDAGGTYLATRVFFSLAYYGYPEEKLAILDGGLSKWQASGFAVSKEPAVAPKGSFRVAEVDEELRARLPEVLSASGDPSSHALVEALGPDWHYGQVAPFDRAGHIPNSVLLPAADFFNADKTFKAPGELRRMAEFAKVRPEQQVYSYCGGGVAASVPFFALKYILGYPKVELFIESELGWLKDPRELPYWTYDAPYLVRGADWLRAWNGKMMRMYGVSSVSLIDVRPKEAFEEGHVPFAINVPASAFASNVATPARLAEVLAAAGVDPSHEAVILSGGGLTKDAALAFAMLEKLGQRKVSVFVDSYEKAEQHGIALTKDPTPIGAKKVPGEISIVPVAYPANLRSGVFADAAAAPGVHPKVYVASGSTPPANPPQGTVVHVPYTELLGADGTPKPAKDIWTVLSKAGVPRYAELITIADDPGEAAAAYFILKLMGFPDVTMLAGSAPPRVAETTRNCG